MTLAIYTLFWSELQTEEVNLVARYKLVTFMTVSPCSSFEDVTEGAKCFNPLVYCLNFLQRWVFAAFFAGAILCLGFSCTFHTVHCHSEFVGKLFSKLDYVGISFLILGSLVPWLYYSFYCQYQPKVVYLTVASVLGLIAIIVSLWDQFAAPEYRSFRAGNSFIRLISSSSGVFR